MSFPPNEYVIWGHSPGYEGEQILYTKAKTMAEAEEVMALLGQKHGCSQMRIQVIDFSVNLADTWQRAVRTPTASRKKRR